MDKTIHICKETVHIQEDVLAYVFQDDIQKIADFINSEITTERNCGNGIIVKVDSISIVFDVTQRTSPFVHSGDEFLAWYHRATD